MQIYRITKFASSYPWKDNVSQISEVRKSIQDLGSAIYDPGWNLDLARISRVAASEGSCESHDPLTYTYVHKHTYIRLPVVPSHILFQYDTLQERSVLFKSRVITFRWISFLKIANYPQKYSCVAAYINIIRSNWIVW